MISKYITPKHRLLVQYLVVALAVFIAGCTREGSHEQIAAFNEAVAVESKTQSLPEKQAAYMRVVAMDPGTKYGKAAAARVEQLSRQMESIIGGIRK